MTSNLKLLIVEDSAVRRAAFRRAAIDSGAEAIETRNGAEAVALAQQHPFAAVVIGGSVAVANDYQILRQLQQLEPAGELPVIVVSLIESEVEREQAYALGALDYFAAPQPDGALRQKLRILVGLHRRRLALEDLLLRIRDDSDELFRQNEYLLAARRHSLRQATHDALTGLPNRELFEDRLGAAIRRSERGRKCFAVATISLDDLTTIADADAEVATAADEWRVQAASRIAETVRASDTVARLGANDFAVLIEAIDSPRRAAALGAKLVDGLHRPVRLTAALSGRPLIMTPKVSAGLAVYPNDALDAQGLLMLSGLALIRAQQRGDGSACIYADDVTPPATTTLPVLSASRSLN